MKKTLANVVIECETLKELFVAELILTKKGYTYEVISEQVGYLYIEIYHELTPLEWSSLLEQIEKRARSIC